MSDKRMISISGPRYTNTLEKRRKNHVYLRWIDNPGDFWVQLQSTEELLEQLSLQLQEVYTNLQPLAQPIPGSLVVARFSQDRLWYRSLVLELFEDGLVKVLFIDYGNSDVVPVTDLRDVTPEFSQITSLASHCRLAGVEPLFVGDKKWANDAKKFLRNITKRGCVCEILHDTSTHKIVKLRVGSRDVAKELLAKNLVRSTEMEPRPLLFPEFPLRHSFSGKVIVKHIDSPRNFWCQVTTNIASLRDLAKQLKQQYAYGKKLPLEEPIIGQGCVVFSRKKKTWCRAKIMNISSSSYDVQFVDHGSAEIVPKYNAFVPEPKFMGLTAQALHCSISVNHDSSILTEAFKKTVFKKELRLHVLEVSANKAIVELFDGQIKISELLKSITHASIEAAQEVDFPPPVEIPIGIAVQAFIGFVVSPSKFFIQVPEFYVNLDYIMVNFAVQISPDNLPPVVNQPHVGQLCLASDKSQWYRSKIVALKPSSCLVLFVDKGQKFTVDKTTIRLLPANYARGPVMSHRVSLHGVQNKLWSEESLQYFETLILNKELTCTFITPESVTVLAEGKDVTSQLLEAGFASAVTLPEQNLLGTDRNSGSKQKPNSNAANIRHSFGRNRTHYEQPQNVFQNQQQNDSSQHQDHDVSNYQIQEDFDVESEQDYNFENACQDVENENQAPENELYANIGAEVDNVEQPVEKLRRRLDRQKNYRMEFNETLVRIKQYIPSLCNMPKVSRLTIVKECEDIFKNMSKREKTALKKKTKKTDMIKPKTRK